MRLFLFISAMLLIVVVCGSVSLAIPTAKDRLAYQQLMMKKEVQAIEKQAIYENRQYREQVVKDIFAKKGQERLQTHITSPKSELSFVINGRQSTFVESYPEGVSVSMQEKLKAPDQIIRQMEGDVGRYIFSTGQLFCNRVKIRRFLAEGVEIRDPLIEKEKLMEGSATQVCLTFKKELEFSCDRFKGKFYGK